MTSSVRQHVEHNAGLFVFGGALVTSIMLVSIVAHHFDGAWESHAIATRQWLTSMAVFICFLGASLSKWRAVYTTSRTKTSAATKALDFIYSNGVMRSVVSLCFVLSALALPASLVAGVAANADTLVSRCVLCLTLLLIFMATFFALKWPAAAAIFRHGVRSAIRSTIAAIGERDRFRITLFSFPLLAGLTIAALAAPSAILVILEAFAMLFVGTYVIRRLTHKSDSVGNILLTVAASILILSLMCTVAWLATDSRRSFAIAFAILQVILCARLRRISLGDVQRWAPLLFASCIGWIFSITYSYTPLANSLLSASESTATSAIAFVGAFGIVILEFTSTPGTAARTRVGNATIWVLAIIIFAELGLRTDSLLADWIPYHRSYWVGPADFVRAGGWLLWDIPAQYGFLSALSLAVWPSASTWQALYEQTALTLVFDGIVLFYLLRESRTGLVNTTFALLVTVATLFLSEGARSPFGWRLYPQAGLRFTGLIALMAVSYAIYKSSGNRRRIGALYAGGFAIWIASIAWSLESGILASIFWMAFVCFDLIYQLLSSRTPIRSAIYRAIPRLLPFLYLPLIFVGIVEGYYRVRLGHGADWTGFFEFSFAFQAEQVELREIIATGPGWVLISVMIGLGIEALRAVRLRLPGAPLVCAVWFGVWGVCSYYVGEGFNNHINVLSPVLAIAIAIVIALRRSEGDAASPPLAVYSLFAPLLILCIAQGLANPTEILSMKAPLIPGYTFDSIAGFDKRPFEIKQLEMEAGVKPGDRIIYPDSNWRVKLSLGLNMPFISDHSGRTIQQVAWLPVSPVGPFDMLMTLPYERRALYLDRYYSQVHETGWLLSYHQAVDCKRYIPTLITVDVHRSLNYEIARCVDQSVAGLTSDTSH